MAPHRPGSGCRDVIEQELLAALQSRGEQSTALRAEAAVLLEQGQAVETALGAASVKMRLALSDAFTQLGDACAPMRGST